VKEHGIAEKKEKYFKIQFFYLHFPYFLTDLDQIWCEGYAKIDVENL
jgi:hypothetical protein